MKSQKVTVDAWKMVTTSIAYLGIAFLAWVFVKLLYACFWLPDYFEQEESEESLHKDDDNYAELEELFANRDGIIREEKEPKKTI